MTLSPRQRLAAIGSIERLDPTMQRALDPSSFEPLPDPGANDWLANHSERGQTFDQFVASRPNRPEAKRRTIHLQPLGSFGDHAPPLSMLQEFAAAFFALAVKVHPPMALDASSVQSRRNPMTGQEQLLTSDILRLLKRSIPADAFCVIAITLIDLYPEPSWNFVFGQASLRERVGVHSFARYLPPFAEGDRHLVLRRSCKVLAHETSHMFGIEHCIFFCCLMNGSNHLAESDARPLHLCPVDLRKLQWSVGFNVGERYHVLLEGCRRWRFNDEAGWIAQMLGKII
jgi:archaemetzincin